MRAVCKEMTGVARFMDAGKVMLQSIHLGGGTPSVLSPRLIGVLLEHASKTFDASEVTQRVVLMSDGQTGLCLGCAVSATGPFIPFLPIQRNYSAPSLAKKACTCN